MERTIRQQLDKAAKDTRSENLEHLEHIKAVREKILLGISKRPLPLYNLLIKLNKEIRIISEDIVLKKGSYTINIKKISQLRLRKKSVIRKITTIKTANVCSSKQSNEPKRLRKPDPTKSKREQQSKYNEQANRDFNKFNKRKRNK